MELRDLDPDECLAGIPRGAGSVRKGWHVKFGPGSWLLVDSVLPVKDGVQLRFTDAKKIAKTYSSIVLLLTRNPAEQIVAVTHAQRSHGKMI